NLADATSYDLLDFVDAAIAQFLRRRERPSISESAFEALMQHELAPVEALRRRFAAGAERGESLEAIVQEANSYVQRLNTTIALWQGPMADRQYRTAFANAVNTLNQRLGRLSSVDHLHRAVQNELAAAQSNVTSSARDVPASPPESP